MRFVCFLTNECNSPFLETSYCEWLTKKKKKKHSSPLIQSILFYRHLTFTKRKRNTLHHYIHAMFFLSIVRRRHLSLWNIGKTISATTTRSSSNNNNNHNKYIVWNPLGTSRCVFSECTRRSRSSSN